MENELSTLPCGFCPACLEQLTEKTEHRRTTLPDGTVLLQAYCRHRKVGALGIKRPLKQLSWKLEVPIDASAWEAWLALRVAAISGFHSRPPGAGPAPETMN